PGYGPNSKEIIQCPGRPWAPQSVVSKGSSYSDLETCQTTWQTNPLLAANDHAVLTDYSCGDRGARLNPKAVQTEALRFLSDLEKVYPGALAAATRDPRLGCRDHLEH